MKHNSTGWLWLPWVLLALLAVGCENRSGQTPPGGLAGDRSKAMRVVSLAPALTQMVVDLGFEHTLVGVAEHDAAAPPGLPVVGHYLDVNIEALLAADPSHVLMMVGRTPAPPRLVELARTGRFLLVTYPMPENVDDVGRILFNEEELIARESFQPTAGQLEEAVGGEVGGEVGGAIGGELEGVSLGTVFGVAVRAQQVKYEMLMRLGELAALTESRPRPRVLVVIGTHPLMASGPGTVADHLLRFAGGHNAAEDATVGAPVYDRETLLTGVRPDVVILMAPGGPPLAGLDQDDRLAVFRGLDIPAVREQRFVLIDDLLAQLPSSTLPRVAAAMTRAIHPDLAEQVDHVMAIPRSELLGPLSSDDPHFPAIDAIPQAEAVAR